MASLVHRPCGTECYVISTEMHGTGVRWDVGPVGLDMLTTVALPDHRNRKFRAVVQE